MSDDEKSAAWESVIRLANWLDVFGKHKGQQFVDDLQTVLDVAKEYLKNSYPQRSSDNG